VISVVSESARVNIERLKAKFVEEARKLKRLKHNNIVGAYDHFEENGTAYYVMEYIDGETLKSMVDRRGALPESEALRYITHVASALKYIHKRDITHLDVKPANIIVSSEDDAAILVDFGLAKHYDPETGHQTTTYLGAQSPGYAPHEQGLINGMKEFTPATDIYSLGATLYTLVTGKVPPEAAVIPSDGLPALPSHLKQSTRDAITRSMSYGIRQRPQSIDEFISILEANSSPSTPVECGCEATMPIGADDATIPLSNNIHAAPKSSGAVHKAVSAVEKHFKELTKHGILMGINKRDKIVTEIMLDGGRLFTIESKAGKFAYVKLQLDTPQVTESYTNLVARNVISGNIHSGFALGNDPQRLADMVTALLNELDPNMGAGRVETKTTLSEHSSIYKPLLISFVCALTLFIVGESHHNFYQEQLQWYILLLSFPVLYILFSPMITSWGQRYSKMERLVKFGSLLIMFYSGSFLYYHVEGDKVIERVEFEDRFVSHGYYYMCSEGIISFGLFFMLYFLVLIGYIYVRVFKIRAKSRSLHNMMELAPSVVGLLLTLTLFIDETMFISTDFFHPQYGITYLQNSDVEAFTLFVVFFAFLQPIFSTLFSRYRKILD
jgi:serine/threonine protein kinase